MDARGTRGDARTATQRRTLALPACTHARPLDRKVEAEALFRALAGEANFFGFLAADQIDAPYTICPTDLPDDKGAEVAAKKRGIARALEFFALNRLAEARREWEFTLPRLSADERRRAAMAARAGWYDRPYTRSIRAKICVL